MAPLRDLDAIAFDAALRLNVSGPAALVAALWPHLEGGRVINIVSGAANRALPGWAAYCASKAALLMLTHSIALEGAAFGLKAFAFAPGLVDTAMQAGIRAARINAISDVPQEDLSPPSIPAKVIAWLATGVGDEFSDTFLDIRQPGLLDRVALEG
jgi:NAD(P)-dependent dehydrogenase (short-subunit alcohol dehydrogenase family)